MTENQSLNTGGSAVAFSQNELEFEFFKESYVIYHWKRNFMLIQKMTIFLCIITNNIVDFGNEYDMPKCVITNIGGKIGTKRGPIHKITYYQAK